MANIVRPMAGSYHNRPPFGRAGAKPAAMQSAWGAGKPPPAKSAPPAKAVASDGLFKIGRVFGRFFHTLGPNIVTIIALIALFAIPERLVVHLMTGTDKQIELASKATLLFAGFGLQLAMVRLALDAFAGKSASFGDCVWQAVRSYLPILAIGLMALLPLALATLLLVVPGLMLMMAWSMTVPVRVAEDAGIFACFTRSMALTRGHRWKIVLTFLLLGFILAPIFLMLQLLWGIPITAHIQFFTVNWLARLIFYAACGLLMASAYFELRQAETASGATADE